MSLDVELVGPISYEHFPCPHCGAKNVKSEEKRNVYYNSNITHNLNKMAERAQIYYHLWRPEEIEIKQAWELIKPLSDALLKLRLDPDYFKELDPLNGWGNYELFVIFVRDYLNACVANPNATIEVDR